MRRRKQQPHLTMGQLWSDGETSALVDAWVPLHLLRSRDNPRSSHPRAKYRNHLTNEDWRAVVAAVNAHRAASSASGHRTTAQCERRVKALVYQPTSCLSRRLRASLDGPPTDLGPAKILPYVEKEKGNDEEEEDEEMDGDDVGSSGGTIGEPAVARKPTNGGWSVAAAVVTKLAEVYERVEMAALDVEKQRIKMESEKHRKNSCSCNLALTGAAGNQT